MGGPSLPGLFSLRLDPFSGRTLFIDGVGNHLITSVISQPGKSLQQIAGSENQTHQRPLAKGVVSGVALRIIPGWGLTSGAPCGLAVRMSRFRSRHGQGVGKFHRIIIYAFGR
jgi:hypothetical protein